MFAQAMHFATAPLRLVNAVVLSGAAEILTQRRETREQLGQRRFGGVGRALWIRGVGQSVHHTSPRQTAR
ncbi:MAG: hypothetical protein P4L81_02065, partial [Candidatus Pacebacteria bacterium]|nr:hypothetical protein [Candidatus Paceibacterota bacterium]